MCPESVCVWGGGARFVSASWMFNPCSQEGRDQSISGDLPLRSCSGLQALIHLFGVCRWKDRPAGECYRGGAEPEEPSGAPGKGTRGTCV